ncbi:MAG: pirin family protein [Rhodospirillaceae bacterium]|nr:pirin family protein [Rhodospirillaceae bacterium]
MIEVRPFETLGQFDNDWLSARYHFSFSDYRDPQRMGFGPLRVWNDDRVRPGQGFAPHGHRDMEIITYIRKGAITHEDHLGNRGRTEAGDVQVMSAGTGITHAEYNVEESDTELFQIWVEPAVLGVRPRWATGAFPRGERAGRLVALASDNPSVLASGETKPLTIHQDATLFGAALRAGESVSHRLEPGRRVYLVAARGRLSINDAAIKARDGVAVWDIAELAMEASEDSELLVLDLP